MKIDTLFEQKGIVEKSFNLYEKSIKFAHVKQEGSLFQILDLKEIPLNNSEKVFLQMAFQKLGIDSKTPIVTNIEDQKILVKKIFIPPMGEGEVLEALRFQFIEETQSTQEMEVRFEKIPEENEDGMQGFIVYGLTQEQVGESRKNYKEWGLNIVAAEPLATSLAAMTELFEESSDKIRGILYKEGKKSIFVGLKGTQLQASKSLGNRQTEEEAPTDWVIEFQQAIDEFLLQEKVSVMEEVLLAGTWSPEEKEKILMTLGIPCRFLGEGDLSQFVFLTPDLKEKFRQFIPEISLAIFPKAIT